MTITYTNEHNIDPILAVWLVNDEYNNGKHLYPDKELISATSLINPIRKTVLAKRMPEDIEIDLSSLIASRFGHALHDSVEKAWKQFPAQCLKKLGYDEQDINTLLVNPEPSEIKDDSFVIYLEQRKFREIDGVIISGQFDQCINGELGDIKSTSTFTYMNQTKEEDYILQGSIYRWLSQDIVTSDIFTVRYLFTDWQSYQAKQNPDYPQTRVHTQEFKLMSLEDTEKYILSRLKEIRENNNKSTDEVVRCNEKELWKSEDKYKYYSDPTKADINKRSTKNFTSLNEAQDHLINKGKGIILTQIGEPKACLYCNVFDICNQRKEYFNDDRTSKLSSS